ncbi:MULTISPECIES: type VI secretion system membrane subunit TssM [Rhizobium/Agrobacterium group]|uniref:type VI secretion system membrane subunit TssM n=1 Tax=Rhizobium/Agrobacterium group TaxID=227290 RepID=UPI0003F1FDC6|nr:MULTISPECIES: type VI secretion system membrane subunit TssM [Rhizobium/Agrobacterium group]AHK04532.1 IcmF-related protein [Agrobacterium tumefaciens LBA4213 (Ach5)]AKC10272.1 type VI secretion system protein ImpL [Agrobacterium tumefaciens]AYM19416.1 type VI secretion system protein ImpL [Agrobacterium tumefaciens]AYM70717.1 type VI secretion system protein ImpL [Agrobacterium tumefaciens]NIB57009.1 type VI secretion system membrane subunit TssM [Agrobacterium tumefaciens]
MNPLSYFYTIRSYVESYAALVGRRFLSLLWVIALCVVIWFYGYLIALGDFKPLGTVQARLIAIGTIVAIWLVYIVVTIYRGRKQDKELVDSIEREALANRQAEIGEIQTRLKEALALLRRVTKKRFGYIYDLPWYVIFGAPGSGKTTALTNSGLQFPLGDALGENAVKGIGGTRNCNWWFADEAILIDTAGRYTTQDDLDGSSKAGWEGFLSLLRRYRRSQPINGALVTLSIPDLLNRDPEEQRQELRSIRQRLSELDEYLRARVPVYIVLTKADLLHGFVEFFDGFNKTDRQQVWGTTFKLDESYSAENLPQRLTEEFELLQQRVDAMLIERLQQEQNAEIRGRIFRFPAELARLKDRLHEALSELCASSPLIEAPLLRGVYFASGTQPETEASPAAPRTRRSYFLSRLFKDVIFPEAALVMRDKRLSGRQLLVRRIAYGASAAAVAIVFTGWIFTYFANTQALAEADRKLGAYEQLVQGIPVRDVADADFLRILPALDNLRDANSGFARERVWNVSFGLDQEDKIAGRQRDAYQRALNALLLPRMIVQLQKQLKDEKDVTRTFNSLKLYGMLGGMGALDRDFLTVQTHQMFASLYPGDGRAAVREALDQHAKALADGVLAPIELDARLIATARETIRDQAIGTRAYDILAGLPQVRELMEWTPATAFGPLGERAFERRSKAPMAEGIEGLFTADGYHRVVIPQVAHAARIALSEGWVRGSDDAIKGATVEQVAQAALQIYFDRFEKKWADTLADLRVKPSQTLGDAVETTRALANERNIVMEAARSIAEATDLRPGANPATLASAAESDATTAVLAASVNASDPYARLRDMLATKGAATAGEQADGDKTGGSPSEQLLAHFKLLNEQLARSATTSDEVAKVFDVDSQLTKANQDLLQQARELPAPLDVWVAGVAADVGSLAVKSARSRIAELWTSDSASLCSSIVTGRYPFDRTSTRDVAIADFTRLFGPEGVFQSFFKQRMEPFVDKTTTPWSWKGTFGAAGLPSSAVAQFENADKISRAFFPNGSETPAVSINVKPVSLTNASSAVMLEIEGERVVYYHGPIQAKSITWPSRENTASLSRIAFQPGGWQQAKTENGDWSPFRLFDGADIENQSGDLLRVRFENGGQAAEFDIQFGSVLNPFKLDAIASFACPAQF